MKLKNGIRFSCQGCGNCCLGRGEYQYVYLTDGEYKRVLKHLGVSEKYFRSRYIGTEDGDTFLKFRHSACPFLKQGRCRIYRVRPLQCRTWPFWPENMSRKVWETEVKADCPGIGKGRMYSKGEIDKMLKRK